MAQLPGSTVASALPSSQNSPLLSNTLTTGYATVETLGLPFAFDPAVLEPLFRTI